MLRRPFTWHRLCLAHPWCQPFPDFQSFRSFSTSSEEGPRSDCPQPASSSETNRIPRGEKTTLGDKTTTNQSSGSPNGSRVRTRSLRPILIPPSFPHSIIPETPVSDPQPSRIQEEMGETDSSVTIALANLPPNTLRTDIRPIFQRFGEVQRIIMSPGGTRADVIFMDAHGVKRTLHAYAEEPLFVREQEVIVFRKCSSEASAGVRVVNNDQAIANTARKADQSRAGADLGDGSGVIFVSQFPSGTTKDELWDALSRFGRYERFVMRPGSKYAYFMYSSDERVEQILRSHSRIPITVRGGNLRIERTANRPYSQSPGSPETAQELGKSLDPEASRAIIEELKQTVPRWRGSQEPSRVLWVGRLPHNVSREALKNFWSRLGCVVEVRASTSGFAHIEFSSTDEALRAARQGAPHGFRYADRLLDVDFAQWTFYIGPTYRVVYISGWPTSHPRPELLQWAYDIPYITGASVLPPFRREERSVPRCVFLQFRTIDDARAGLHRLDGREGPGGEALRFSLSCFPAVHLKQLWEWAYEEDEMRRRGNVEAYFEREWDGLGFGTGMEKQDGPVSDAHAHTSVPPMGTRGGRVPLPVWKRAGVAVAGGLADGSEEGGAHGDEALEEAMGTPVGDAERADLDVLQSLP